VREDHSITSMMTALAAPAGGVKPADYYVAAPAPSSELVYFGTATTTLTTSYFDPCVGEGGVHVWNREKDRLGVQGGSPGPPPPPPLLWPAFRGPASRLLGASLLPGPLAERAPPPQVINKHMKDGMCYPPVCNKDGFGGNGCSERSQALGIGSNCCYSAAKNKRCRWQSRPALLLAPSRSVFLLLAPRVALSN
jgi:hypothetical protein